MRIIHNNIAENERAQSKKRRCELELLQRRIPYLSGQDRVLMTLYAEKGLSVKQISKITGICRSTIARRIDNISKRLTYGKYFTLLQKRNLLSAGELDIAKDYFLNGLSGRTISKRQGVGKHTALRTIRKIKRIISKNKGANHKLRIRNY